MTIAAMMATSVVNTCAKSSMARIILLLELSQKTHESWLKIAKDRGMTQVTVASRLIDWYAKQPHTIQALIWGIYRRRCERKSLKSHYGSWGLHKSASILRHIESLGYAVSVFRIPSWLLGTVGAFDDPRRAAAILDRLDPAQDQLGVGLADGEGEHAPISSAQSAAEYATRSRQKLTASC